MKPLVPLLLVALSGSPLAADGPQRLAGWDAQVSGVTEVPGGHRAAWAEVALGAAGADQRIRIPDVVYDLFGQVLSSGRGTGQAEVKTRAGWRVKATSWGLGKEGLDLGGVLVLPSASVAFPPGALGLRADGTLGTRTQAPTAQLTVGGVPIDARGLGVEGDRLRIAAAQALLPGVQPHPLLGSLTLDAQGRLVEAAVRPEVQADLQLGAWRLTRVRGTQLIEGAVVFQGDLRLPPPLDQVSAGDGRRCLLADGTVGTGLEDRGAARVSYRGFTATLTRTLNGLPEALWIEEGTIQMPPALGGASLDFQGYGHILGDGTWVPQARSAAWPALGLPLLVDTFRFDAQGLVVTAGGLRLPSTLPGDLANAWLPLGSLSLSGQGALAGTLDSPWKEGDAAALAPGLVLFSPRPTLTQGAPGQPGRVVFQGDLMAMHQALPVPVPLEALAVDFGSGTLDLAHLALGPWKFTSGGLSFDLRLLRASPRLDLTFTGKAVGADGRSWTVDRFEVDPTGAPGAVVLSSSEGSFTAIWTAPTWTLAASDSEVGLPLHQRAVINQEGVTGRKHPSLVAEAAGDLPIGTVVVIDGQSLGVDTVGGVTDRWYRYQTAQGTTGWLFATQRDVLR